MASSSSSSASSVIGSFQQSSTSFYSDTVYGSGATDLRHDDILLQLHTEFAVVPALSHRLGFPAMEVPSLEQVIDSVRQYDYVRYENVDHYILELRAAINRRYGETLRLWFAQTQRCTRCHADFKWATSIGQWQCYRHMGFPIDHTRKRWSCCATRTDLPLERRFNGCMRCDHTTLDLDALNAGGQPQPQPDMVRMPIILLDKLNVRPEALHRDCLTPWVPPQCIDPLTNAPPPPPPRCFKSHVLTDVVFAEPAVRQASLGGSAAVARSEASSYSSSSSSSSLAPSRHRLAGRYGNGSIGDGSAERYCMISLFEVEPPMPTRREQWQLAQEASLFAPDIFVQTRR